MLLDESHKYYSLKIPKNAANNLLVITTHEDSSIGKNTKESFSDPDFYISKKNKYPSSRRSSEWYSEQYGADIISIPSESVQENDIFYIGMYCQFKCKYFLKIETAKESEINLNDIYNINLKPFESINYKLKINSDFSILKVISYSLSNGKFKIFMNKNLPSSANSFRVIPSWDSGYAIIIKQNTEEYCTQCEYHIIIYNEENDDNNDKTNEIFIRIITEDDKSIKNMNELMPLFDAMESNSKRCFSYNITSLQKFNEKLILDLTVFSGEATLYVEGWSHKNNINNNNYTYRVIMEKHIILDRKDFDFFDKENNYYTNKDSILYFCISTSRQISYKFEVYFLSEFNKIKHVSLLAPGNKLRTYLLKDQITSYELLIDYASKSEYDIETNITLIESQILGNTSFYGYYCKDEICNITQLKDFQNLEKNNELIKPTQNFPYTSILNIPHNDNYCIKNPKIKTKKGNLIDCVTLALIKCDEPSIDNNICVFDLQLNVKDAELIMKPKQVYSGTLPLGKTDKYKITINDEDIKDLFIVLNTESGNAQLSVYLEKENSMSFISISRHNDYIPDVVRVTPQKIGKDNLIGNYIIKVYPETFSSYKIYYYILYNKKENEENNNFMPEVTMNLNIGQLIMDYFPNDIRYKIYSFYPLLRKKSNIKFFINRVNINFDIYIFTDISKFEIVQLFDLKNNPSLEPIKGYQWKSNTNNELIISKDDENFSLNKILYIIVAPTNPLNFTKTEQEKLISKFYIGIISEYFPFSITEGMPHTMTLSNSFSQQMYLRIHSDLNKNFQIVINLLLGEIDIFASTKYFTPDDIDNIDITKARYDAITDTFELDDFIFKINIKSFTYFELSSDYIKEHKIDSGINNNINIYYYIKRSESMIVEKKIVQYVILERTSETKAQYLMPGVISSGHLNIGKKINFIIEEVEKRKSPFITVYFKQGFGNVYVKIPETPENSNQMRFPDEGNYDYKGIGIYSGKLIRIPEKEFNKLKNGKLQILVTISAELGSYQYTAENNNNNKEVIEYSISYSNEPKRLNQNVPYDGYIYQGEVQYFNLYFDKSTENIYIGLTNMNGDADLYVNKGNILPTIMKNDWRSNENAHEYIEISKDDEYFKKNNCSISGYYSLLLVGFMDTSFSLFVSTHKNKVFPLRDNIPMGCWCEKKEDKCYFRYNNVYDKNSVENGLDHNDFVFTSEYLYGSGFMYAKVFIDKEIHDTNKFYNNFPDKNNYDVSNKESNQLNYIKVKVEGEKYQKDSTILLTFECNQKTKVDITSTSLRHFSSVDYLSENRENVYYLGKNHKTGEQAQLTLIINNFMEKDKDLIYSVHSYIGDAHFKVYGNSSNWDDKIQKLFFNFKLLNEFDIITNDKNQETNIEIYNPFSHDYHNFVDKKDKEKYDEIYIYAEPKNEFGFFISYNYDKNWNKINIGKSQSFFVINQEFYGYFDINDEYQDVEFSLWVQNNLKMYAEVFIKINVIDKFRLNHMKKNSNKKHNQFSLYHYSYPSSENYDYKGLTDKTLGKASINIGKLPKLKESEIKSGSKFVRALLYVRLGQINFESIEEEKNENDNNEEIKEESNDMDESKTMINIVISPGIDYFKYVQLKPYEFYYSNLQYRNREKKIENKVYSMDIENLDHDLLIIEISTCFGNYEINIQKELITKENINKQSLPYESQDYNGKKIIILENIQSKHYYLNVRSKKNKILNKIGKKRNQTEIGNNLMYLIYYYTAYSENFNFQEIDKWIIHRPYGKGQIKLDLPLIITNDLETNKKQISDYKFDVFATKDKDYTSKMGSICYLSRLIPDENKIFKVESMSIENKTSLILKDLIPGNRYYINVLAQNLKTKEMITFHPIEVFTGGFHPIYRHLIRTIFVICLFVGVLYFAYQYKKTKDELIFLKGDTYPKTEKEIRNMGYESPNVKYTGLGSSY